MMWLLLTPILIAVVAVSGTHTRFTNIDCVPLDREFVAFKKCELKVIGRGVVGLNVHVQLLNGSFTNAKVNLSLWRKYNGFRPYMYNITIDFCEFMSAQKKSILSFEKIFFDAINVDCNVNHSCPHNHDLICHNLVFKEDFVRYFPVPSEEYKLQIMGATNKKWRGSVALLKN